MREYFSYRKLFKTPIRQSNIIQYVFQLLCLFLDWVFKKKLFLSTTSISIFSLYTLGEILNVINIPLNSMDSNFLLYLPVMLNSMLIKTLFSWQFVVTLFASIFVIICFIKKEDWTVIHIHRLIAFILIIYIGAFFWMMKNLSNTDLPKELYTEMTGYPKIIQSHDKYYTLLGDNNMAYNLNKSLTIERCSQLNKIVENNTSGFYYMLIKKIDNNTFPNNAVSIKDDNFAFFDYKQSRRWVHNQCQEVLKNR